MKNLVKLVAAGCAGLLVFSPVSFAAPPPPEPTTTVIFKPAPPPPGWKVCYKPSPQKVQSSRIVQRCGYYGCQNFRVIRTFQVTAYTDCHKEKYSCPKGYRTFGWYPDKEQTVDAISRCSSTFKTNTPMMMPNDGQWNVNYTPGDEDNSPRYYNSGDDDNY